MALLVGRGRFRGVSDDRINFGEFVASFRHTGLRETKARVGGHRETLSRLIVGSLEGRVQTTRYEVQLQWLMVVVGI